MRRLLLLRHAKSSWDDPGVDDHERPLAPRGRAASSRLRTWLEAQRVHPQLVVSSTAARATETLALVLPEVGRPPVALEAGLYHASARQLLERVRVLPDAIDEAMLVGHNPGLQDLVLLLASPSPERDRVAAKLPTGALVALVVPASSWREIAPASASIEALVLPRELAAGS